MEPTNSVRVGVSSDSVSQADVCAMNSAQPYASESNSIPVEFVVEETASPSTELMGGSRLDGYTLGSCCSCTILKHRKHILTNYDEILLI